MLGRQNVYRRTVFGGVYAARAVAADASASGNICSRNCGIHASDGEVGASRATAEDLVAVFTDSANCMHVESCRWYLQSIYLFPVLTKEGIVMKNKYYIYIALFLVICLLPSAGLLFSGIEESTENRETAGVPVLFEEDGINAYFLNDAGKWFEDHFAFRNETVTGYAMLLGKGFGVSSQERVIVGKDGWLFYKDSLADFQGTEQMTERQLFDVAHSMAMIQEYAQKNGIQFAFTIAPNKNSLYGSYMPYYYQPFRKSKGNMERLKKYLQAEGVNYIDLYEMLSSKEQILYHKRDSHWNNEGAALAADKILSCIEKEHVSYEDRKYTVRKDFEGDLDQMLYPAAIKPEEEIYYDPMPQFAYCEEVESNFAPKINTIAAGTGNLVMYRDSFGNALLPYMAEAYESAYFSRALPYQLQDLSEYGADTLIIERAERFLPDMAQEAPYMEAPRIKEPIGMPQTETSQTKAQPKMDTASFFIEAIDLEEINQGAYTKVTGKVPAEKLKNDSRIYVRVNGAACYEAFPISYEDGQEGFSMLLPTDLLKDRENVYELFL